MTGAFIHSGHEAWRASRISGDRLFRHPRLLASSRFSGEHSPRRSSENFRRWRVLSPAISPPRASSPKKSAAAPVAQPAQIPPISPQADQSAAAIPESLTVPDQSTLGRLQDVVAGRTSASELLDTSPNHAPLAVDPAAHPDTAQALLHEVNDFLAAAGVKARLSLLTETMSGVASAPNLLSAVLLNADADSDRFAQIGRAYALLQSGRERFPWMPEAIELLWPEKNGRMSRYRNGIPSPGVALALGESRYVLALLAQSRAPIPAYMPFSGQAPFPGALYHYFDKDPAMNADRLMAEDRDGWVVYRLSPRVEPGESLLWHDYYLLWTSREPGK